MSAVDVALIARMETATGAGVPVYDGLVPLDTTGRPTVDGYAVYYGAPAQRVSDDLAAIADRYVHRFQVTSVGRDRLQADWVASRCRDGLVDQRLEVDGWHVGVVVHSSSSPIRRDEDIPGKPLFYAVDTYELPATR